MSFIGKNPKLNTLTHKPQDDRPANAVVGTSYYDSGLNRASGLWEFDGANWSRVGAGVSDKSVYGQFDAEDQDLTGFTNVSISSDALNETFSYSVDAYPASLPVLTLSEKQKQNKLNGVELFYRLTSGSATLALKDDLGNEQTVLLESTSVQQATIQLFVADTVTSVQLEIRDNVSATGLIIDDIRFTDSPFVSTQFSENTDWEQYTPLITGLGTTTNNSFFYRREGTDLLIQACFTAGTVTNTKTEVTLPTGLFSRTNMVSRVVGHAARTGTSTGLYGISVIVESNSSVLCFGTRSPTQSEATIRTANLVNSGETIYFETRIPIEGWKPTTENLVFSRTGTENTFSACVSNNGTASIETQNLSFIQSVVTTGVGIVDVTYVPGFFQVKPSLALISRSPSAGIGISVFEESASGCRIRTVLDGSSAVNRDFYITAINQGSDYKNPNAYAVTSNQQIACLLDVKPSGTNGGTFTAGSYQTRELNTQSGDNFVSLNNNQFTLPAGKYLIEAGAPCQARGSTEVGFAKARLFNITDNDAQIIGTAASIQSTPGTSSVMHHESLVLGSIEITEPKTFELQHRCSITAPITGFGLATSFGDDEVYSKVKITKLK